ncbi:fimbriae assembly protein [Novosphingobium marinum]|uniref:Pilus assembly protein CpaC n=1 Tax=Novosphingobium marinum TaxID=1514948 RepID=A0A7Z0BUN9_9SPHN|nr:type II and III secretion system protein family protein [Novosphingobium marinum]NYH96469.1 pilus assembly protein CpaC [Novosphingobium marinum]GGC35474.1 fimbriae assembly protein [Novosphingobium marinum]
MTVRTDNQSHGTKGQTMKRRLIKTLLSAACAMAPVALLPAAPAQAQSRITPNQDISLSIGHGELVNVPGTMSDVFISNEAVADVQIKSGRQFYVFGKSGGETTVYASNAAGDVIWSANVRVGSNLSSVDQMLRLAMPEAKIGVSTMGTGTFLLTGTVGAPEDAAEAERLVSAFVGEEANVISRLKMATPLQVNLQVRIAEVSRSLVREFGSNLATQDNSGNFLFGLGRGRSPGTIGTLAGTISGVNTNGLPVLDASQVYNLPKGTISLPFDPVSGKYVVPGTTYSVAGNQEGQTVLNLAGRIFGLNVLAALDLGERVGLVNTLSNPNLTALSGETAEFLAGGEFPIPISQGLGATSIQYRKYGVSLSYTPTVLANGRISLRVRPEVSELSSQGSVVLNGFEVPALTVRRAETTIELGSGQSFMIAGLLSNASQNNIEKTPGIGDMPILGSLFRSTSYRRGETELVIIVTPYLVNPVDANDIVLPTDGYSAPNEVERILGNAEAGGDVDPRPKPRAAPSQSAPAPTVGAAEPAPQEKQRGKKKDRRAQASSAPTPGFSLN